MKCLLRPSKPCLDSSTLGLGSPVVPFHFFGSRFPYKVTNPKKRVPLLLAGLPRGLGFLGFGYQLGTRRHSPLLLDGRSLVMKDVGFRV